jgi:hypothetical protein
MPPSGVIAPHPNQTERRWEPLVQGEPQEATL